MAIIVSKDGRTAKVDKSEFDKEDSLQKFIYDNPDSIPLYDIKEDVRVLVIAREFPTDSGPIDALGIDQDGDIYCVETKLYKNPDKRLVVAQVLDYGASLWKTYRDFGAFLAKANEKLSPTTLQQRMTEFFGLAGDELDSALETLRANLLEGRFKFVVLMNQLHDQLKDLIVFLNQNSQFAIYAVEVEYYRHEGYEILIPKLYGAEVKKPSGGSASRGKWDETSFFSDARQKLSKEQFQVIEDFYKAIKGRTSDIGWGTGKGKGSFSPRFQEISGKSLISLYSNGTLTLNFGWLRDSEIAVKKRDLFAAYLKESVHLSIPTDYRDRHIYLAPQIWMPVADAVVSVIDKLRGS